MTVSATRKVRRSSRRQIVAARTPIRASRRPLPITMAGTPRTRNPGPPFAPAWVMSRIQVPLRARPAPSWLRSAHGLKRIDRQPGITRGRVEDLADQAHDREPERQTEQLGRGQPDDGRRDEATRPVAGWARHQVAAEDQDRGQGNQDPELGLDDRGDRRQERRSLVPATPQVADREQQHERADRVDLGPHRAVEPGDRHEQDGRGGGQRGSPARAQVRGEQEDRHREPQVGHDRGQLQQGARGRADPAEELGDQPEAPQDVQVPGRVVDEDRSVVDAERPVPGELHRPAVEQRDVDLEPGPGQEDVCDDEPEGEAEREKDAERDGNVPKPHPGLLARPRPLARCGASQGERPP